MTTTKLKRRQIINLNLAIVSIRGREEPIKDENGKVLGQYVKPYELDVKARYAMARTVSKIEDSVETIQSEQNKIIVECQKQKVTEAEVQVRLADFLREEEEVDLFQFPIESLKIVENKISPHVISGLLPMLIVGEDFGK